MRSCFSGWKGSCNPGARNDFYGHYLPVLHSFDPDTEGSDQYPYLSDSLTEEDNPKNPKRTDIFVRSDTIWEDRRDPMFNDSEKLAGWSIPYADGYDWNIVSTICPHSSEDADVVFVLCSRFLGTTPGFTLKLFCLDARTKTILWSQVLPTSFSAVKPNTADPGDPDNSFTIFSSYVSFWFAPIVSTQTPDIGGPQHTRGVLAYDSNESHSPNEGTLNAYTEDGALADKAISWLQTEILYPTGEHILLCCNEDTVAIIDFSFVFASNSAVPANNGTAIIVLEINSSGTTAHKSVAWNSEYNSDLTVNVPSGHTSPESYSTKPRFAGFCPRTWPKAFFYYPAVQYTFDSTDLSQRFAVWEHVKLTFGDFVPGTLNETTLETVPFSVDNEEVVFQGPVYEAPETYEDHVRPLKQPYFTDPNEYTKNDIVRTSLQFIAGDANEAGDAGCVFLLGQQNIYENETEQAFPYYGGTVVWSWYVKPAGGSFTEVMRLNPIDQDNDGEIEEYTTYPAGQVWRYASDFKMLPATEESQIDVSGRLFATFYNNFDPGAQKWILRVAHVNNPDDYWELISAPNDGTTVVHTTASMPHFIDASDRYIYINMFPMWDHTRGRVHHAWRISHDGKTREPICDDFLRKPIFLYPSAQDRYKGFLYTGSRGDIYSTLGPRTAVVQHPSKVDAL